MTAPVKSSPTALRVLGVDHGLLHTGYGVVAREPQRVVCLDWGVIVTSPRQSLAQRLQRIYGELGAVIQRWKPDVMAIEAAIYAQNVRTALLMGQARSAALLAGANRELPIFEYSPKRIKSAVVGNGSATKDQVRFMVSRILGLPERALNYDAADALAAGICHMHQLQLR